MALDQRERLQHRVVHTRRDLGALVRPDPREALRVLLPSEPPDPRADEQDERDGERARRDRSAAGERTAGRGEGDDSERDQHEARNRLEGERPCEATPAGHAPDQGHADRDHAGGPDQRVGETETAQGEEAGEDQEQDACAEAEAVGSLTGFR